MKYPKKTNPITISDVRESHSLIKDNVSHTDLVTSTEFNSLFGNTIYFKLENLQTTGSFKFRGALYSILKLVSNPPKGIVTYGTGNHAVALAWAARKFLNIHIKAYLTDFTSNIKKSLAKEYGAEIIFTKTREEAERLAKLEAENPEMLLLPPSDSNDIIAGAGTAILEAFEDLAPKKFDAIFVPIGGGSIASGSVVVRNGLSTDTKIYGSEPLAGNDAARSYRSKEIFRFPYDPETIADGARTPGISQRTFNYILQLDDIFEIPEQEIEYWTAWFFHLMKMQCEPTSALALAAAFKWSQKNKDQTILVVITGHNINDDIYDFINRKNYISVNPNEFYNK